MLHDARRLSPYLPEAKEVVMGHGEVSIKDILEGKTTATASHFINWMFPAFVEVHNNDMVIDFDAMLGFLGPTLLMTTIYGQTFNLFVFGIEFVAGAVVVIDGLNQRARSDIKGFDCASDNAGVLTPFNYVCARLVIGSVMLVIRTTIAHRAFASYKECTQIHAETIQLSEDARQEVIAVNAEEPNVMRAFRIRRVADATVYSGLRMLQAYTQIVESWLFQIQMYLFLFELIYNSLVILLIWQLGTRDRYGTEDPRFPPGTGCWIPELPECFPDTGARNVINALIFTSFWNVLFWFPHMMEAFFFIMSILRECSPRIWNWQKKHMIELDTKLFFGAPILETTFDALYLRSPSRSERIDPLIELYGQRHREKVLRASIPCQYIQLPWVGSVVLVSAVRGDSQSAFFTPDFRTGSRCST